MTLNIQTHLIRAVPELAQERASLVNRDARPRRTRRSHESSCSVSCLQELRDLIGQQYIDTIRTEFAAN